MSSDGGDVIIPMDENPSHVGHVILPIREETCKDHVVIPLYAEKSCQYTGYSPKSAADFAYGYIDSDYARKEHYEDHNARTARTSKWLSSKRCTSLVLVVATILFIFTVVISAFSLECKLGLCDKLDRSTRLDTRYIYKNFAMPAPYKYVWASLVASILGIALVSIFFFFLLKKDTGDVGLTNFVLLIRSGTRAFINRSHKYLVLIVIPLFVVIGLLNTWRSAACFLFGSVFSVLAGSTLASVGTRGAKSTTIAAQESLKACLEAALRTGSVVGVAVISCSLFGLAMSYLIFQDIRALGGFIAAVSCVALFSRVAGGMFKKASNVGSDSMIQLKLGILDDDVRNPACVANAVGDILGGVVGMSVDFMASHSAAIAATAILGASLPYFYDNSYAMCVFNHLWIDRTCVAYESPTVKISFAASVCRNENFHIQYTKLEVWQSNALFVALPFLLGIVGILSTAACSLRFFLPRVNELPSDRESRVKQLKSVLLRLRLNVVVSTILTLACAAGICWGLFGQNSSFKTANTSTFDRYELQPLTPTNALTRCRPLEAEEGGGRTDLPDLRLVRGSYKPINPFGVEYPPASEIPWRLFLCIFLGSVLGLGFGTVPDYVSNLTRSPVRRIASAGERGAGSLIIEGIGTSFVSTVAPLAISVTIIGISFRLFGTYGVGLSAVGLVSSLGSVITFHTVRPIAENAKAECQALPLHSVTKKIAGVGSMIGTSASAVARGISSGSTVLSSFTLLAVIIQESGLMPSPRQLAGSTTIQPSRHITDTDTINVMDVYVLVSIMLGILLPCFFAALLLLSGSYEGQVMMRKVGQHLGQFFTPGNQSLAQQVPSLRAAYARCVNMASSSAIIETTIPGLLGIVAPLVIGFGFGQRALLGMTVAVIAISFMLSTTLSNAGAVFECVRRAAEDIPCTGSPGSTSNGSNAAISGDSVGRGLTDCCSPSLSALTKAVCCFGLVSVRAMQPGIERGWIGLILLAAALVAGGLLAFFSDRRREVLDGNMDANEGFGYENSRETVLRLNPDFVSPFYEDGYRIPEDQISPVSDFAKQKGIEAVRFGSSEDESDGAWSPVAYNPSEPPANYYSNTGSATVTITEE